VRALADMAQTQPASVVTPGRNWRDLRTRLLSALLLAPLGLVCIWVGGALFAVLLLVLLAAAGFEWAGLLRLKPGSIRGVVLMAWPAIACLAALTTGQWREAALMLAAPILLGPLVAAGSLAIGLAGLSLLWLRQTGASGGSGWQAGDGDAVLFVVLVVIASDSAAYLAGRAIGGPKLAPSISPGKTRSGSAGGLLGAGLVGALLAWLLPAPPGIAAAAVLARGLGAGLLLGLVAQAGDLAESAFKRRCGVKDSGRLIPGHGGLLDRFDGLLAAAPIAALLSLATPVGTGFWYAGLTTVPADSAGASRTY
jgi:phosphatidate cytidylyltransferase